MREQKNISCRIEGYLALSHKKNPAIFDCVTGENRRIFTQNPARPRHDEFCSGSTFDFLRPLNIFIHLPII